MDGLLLPAPDAAGAAGLAAVKVEGLAVMLDESIPGAELGAVAVTVAEPPLVLVPELLPDDTAADGASAFATGGVAVTPVAALAVGGVAAPGDVGGPVRPVVAAPLRGRACDLRQR